MVLLAQETSTYSWSRFCIVNCRSSVTSYHLSTLCLGFEPLISEVGGECGNTAPLWPLYINRTEDVKLLSNNNNSSELKLSLTSEFVLFHLIALLYLNIIISFFILLSFVHQQIPHKSMALYISQGLLWDESDTIFTAH